MTVRDKLLASNASASGGRHCHLSQIRLDQRLCLALHAWYILSPLRLRCNREPGRKNRYAGIQGVYEGHQFRFVPNIIVVSLVS